MSFKKPYQKGKVVHRGSRKQRYSATVGYLKPNRYRRSKETEAPRDEQSDQSPG